MAKKKKSYHFDLGNSSTGPIGLCARVIAKSKKAALAKLRMALDEQIDLQSNVPGVEYINVYINDAAITKKDIDSVDDVDELEDDEPEAEA